MKTNYLNRFKHAAIIMLTVSLGLTACKKDQRPALNADENTAELAGNWKLNDMMQVNNEDGSPRNNSELSSMNYTLLQLGSQGKFIASGSENGQETNGSWNVSGEQLTLRKSNGESILLNIVSAKADSLTLTQNYAATGGKASGTIYYPLNK